MKSDCFKQEFKLIRDKNLRDLVIEYMEKYVPDYFYVVPASSSGKYHPKYTLGEGGLVRHTKACVVIAEELLTLEQYGTLDHDEIISALLIHDSFKQGLETDGHTKFEHPVYSAKAFTLFTKEYHPDMIGVALRVSKLVISHMGQWNTSKYSRVTLPKPQTASEKFVHMCDYLASRKSITIDVGEYGTPKEKEEQ
jgi:23S rRNA maturation-related 3'-5' exoribonuclease YhaM